MKSCRLLGSGQRSRNVSISEVKARVRVTKYIGIDPDVIQHYKQINSTYIETLRIETIDQDSLL